MSPSRVPDSPRDVYDEIERRVERGVERGVGSEGAVGVPHVEPVPAEDVIVGLDTEPEQVDISEPSG